MSALDIRSPPLNSTFSPRHFVSLHCVSKEAKMSGVLVQNMSFKTGQTLTVTGVPSADSTNFAINIGHSAEDIALHMNPRFDAHGDQRTIVCNSFQDGNWCEEHREASFPFNPNEEFQIKITFTNEEFLMTLSDGCQIRFPNRQGAEKYKYMFFEGEGRIHGIEIK